MPDPTHHSSDSPQSKKRSSVDATSSEGNSTVSNDDSSAANMLSKFVATIDWSTGSPDEHRQTIRDCAGDPDADPWPAVQIRKVTGPGFLMGLDAAVRLQVESSLGNHAFSYAAMGEARVIGDIGHSVGDGLCGGVVRVRGNAGDGVGVSMQGGTIAIYGSAGDRAAASMRGGGVFVRGNVGDDCGYGAIGGLIVIGGNAGMRLGQAAQNVSIFIRGDVGSLADGMTEAPLRKRELLRLGMVLINASIRGEAKEFRRIVPVDTLDREKQSRGEVNPSWR